jgi:uncharacterized membrane protein (UPF0127 family)
MMDFSKLISKQKVLIFFLILFFLGTIAFLVSKKDLLTESKKPFVSINNHKIFVEIADTPSKTSQGLSDREFLASNQGMLFIFPQPRTHPFWMKRMKFNLDFVFIKGDTVVDLVENIPYPQQGKSPQTVMAKKSFDRVLEVNAGTIKKLNIKTGDQIRAVLK